MMDIFVFSWIQYQEGTPSVHQAKTWEIVLAIIFLFSIAILAISNVVIFFTAKVYRRCMSTFIYLSLFAVILMRAVQYTQRLVNQSEWYYENWMINRLLTDITAYFIGIVSTALYVQWHQTYNILDNPQKAIKQITNNTA